MLSNISPIRPNPKEEAGRGERTKPQGQPPNDRFRKSMRDRPTKEEEREAVEDREKPSSVFDLSKSNKTKSKSSLSKSTKDSDANLTPNRPITAKQGRDQNQGQSQNQDQDQDQDSDSFGANSKIETASSDIDQQTVDDQLYATADEQFPKAEEGFQEIPQPQTTDEQPPTVEEGFQETEAPQPPMPKEMKKPIDQAQQSQPRMPGEVKKPIDDQAQQSQPQTMEALKREQAASALQQSQKLKGSSDKESSFETSQLGKSSKKSKTGKSEEARSEKGNEAKGEATGGVNSSIQAASFQTEKAEETQETTHSATIREIATQIVDRIQIMRKDNETQTTITLRHPPVLEGATITLTTSDHAKREFNISFANLSPEAKLMLDRRLKEDSLTQTLERKGIIVHMLTTSTQAENLIATDAGQASRDRQDQQQQQQEQQQRKQSFQGEEEEEVT